MSRLLKRLCLGLAVALLVAAAACSDRPGEDERGVVARINDYDLTLKEYEIQLNSDVSVSELYNLTREDKQEFLNRLIRKELLLQEAMRRKLDQREEFVRTIERYWEATLIRDLMSLMGEEVCKRVSITEEQVRARYDEMKAADGGLPEFEEIKEQIGRALLEEEREARLNEWMDKLREEAEVEVNEALIKP
jgi:hypothetical protein